MNARGRSTPVSYPLGAQITKWGESQSLVQVRQGARTGEHEVRSRAERRLWAPHRPPPRQRRELGPPATASGRRPVPHRRKGSLRGGGGRYLEILHFLRPASSATAAATPGAFLFFFTGIFRLPRQGGQGGRGRGSRSAAGPAAPAPACQGPQRRPEARPRGGPAPGLLVRGGSRQRSASPGGIAARAFLGQGTPTARHLQ